MNAFSKFKLHSQELLTWTPEGSLDVRRMFVRFLLICFKIHVSNSATHSVRRGGTTTLFNVRAPIAYVKDRGQWKSNGVFKYITPTLGDKCVIDKKFTLR